MFKKSLANLFLAHCRLPGPAGASAMGNRALGIKHSNRGKYREALDTKMPVSSLLSLPAAAEDASRPRAIKRSHRPYSKL